MLFKYHFKQQSKIMLGIAGTFTAIVLIFNMLSMKNEWFTLNLIIVLLPMFFTANIFSSESENGTDFLIFTSRTPKYKILIQKYLSAWITSEAVLTIIYVSALVAGMEKSIFGLLALILYSTLFSLLGLLISNITSNTLLGYGVPLGIWSLQIMLGADFHESHPLLSTNVNLIERSVQVWSNVLFVIILIILLCILNLFIVSKGEHLRKKLTYTGTVAMIAVSLICLFLYNSFLIKLEFWHDNTWKVVNGKNINLHYKNLDNKRADEMLKVCDVEAENIEDIFGINVCYNEFYTWHSKKRDLNKNKVYMLPFQNLKSFNPTEYSGEYWHEHIGKELMEPMFKKLESNKENDILKGAWQMYIYNAYIIPNSKDKFKENKLIIEPSQHGSKDEYMKRIDEELKENMQSEKERSSIFALGDMSEALIYKLDKSNHENTIKLFKYINNSEKNVSYEDIKKIINKNYKDKSVDETLKLYQEVREYHKQYY